MAKRKYVRFTVLSWNGRRATEDGIFVAAYDLAWNGLIPHGERDRLIDMLTWFSNNLDQPARFNRGGGKGWRHRETRGLSWFKPEATDQISKVRELASLLADHGIVTEQVEAARIGYVVYEDEHQVVAEPFTDIR